MSAPEADPPLLHADLNKEILAISSPNVALAKTPILQDLISTHDLTTPGSLKKKIRYQAELQKSELKRQQLTKEFEHLKELYETNQQILIAETMLALSKIDDGDNETEIEPVVHKLELLPCDSNITPYNPRFIAESSAPPLQHIDALGELLNSKTVLIEKIETAGLEESYQILNEDGDLFMKAKVNFAYHHDDIHGKRMMLKVDFTDLQDTEIISFGPKNMFSMEVKICNNTVYFVKRVPTLIKPVLTVQDPQGNQLLRIKGPPLGGDKSVFDIITAGKIGVIAKNKIAFTGSRLNGAPVTVIAFPKHFDLHSKAAVLACNFLIIDKEQFADRAKKMRNHFVEDIYKTDCYLSYN